MSDTSITGPSQSISTLVQPSTTSAATAANSLGKDAFLKLLVAQLKYQNPLSPADPTEFMSQTAQFTMVEKLENLDASFTKATDTQRLTLATTLIGKQIRYLGADGKLTTGTVASARVTTDGTLVKVGDTELTLYQIDTVLPAASSTSS